MFLSAAVHAGAAECLGAGRRFASLVRGRRGVCGAVLRSSPTREPRIGGAAAELLALPPPAHPVAHTAAHSVLRLQEHPEPALELQR